MFVLGWGVAGAAIATTTAQYASFAVMYYLMLKKGILRQQDMATVPGLAQVLPILRVSIPLTTVFLQFVLWSTAAMVAGTTSLHNPASHL